MKVITLIEMMEQEEYQALTCAEFANIIRKSGVLENDLLEEEISFLTDKNWKAETVTHHTTRRTK